MSLVYIISRSSDIKTIECYFVKHIDDSIQEILYLRA